MSLLRDIQSSAIESSFDLETLLRMCRVLAARLDHLEFKNWVIWELDGYPVDADLPSYREFHTQCAGHFNGPFGSGLKNAPIPEVCIPEKIRKSLTYLQMRDGVATLKHLVGDKDDSLLRFQWPADAYPMFGDKIYERMVLAQAWMQVSKSDVVGILSTIRNRILNFALEIEASHPDAGESCPDSEPVPKEKVNQIFHTNIYGNVGNVATGTEIHQDLVINVQKENWETLEKYLKDQNVPEMDIVELKSAIAEDPGISNGHFGKKIAAWIGKMIQKAAEGTWKVGLNVASNVLTEGIKAYYGLP